MDTSPQPVDGKKVVGWLEKARAGCQIAMGKLLEYSRRILLRRAQEQMPRELRAKAGPSDLVQDTLIEAQQSFPSFRGTTEEEFLAWVSQILQHNLSNCYRAYRQAKRDVSRELPLGSEADPRGSTDMACADESPLDNLVTQERFAHVEATLRKLPNVYHYILRLRFEHGYSFKEIAHRCGFSESTARRFCERALQDFAEQGRFRTLVDQESSSA